MGSRAGGPSSVANDDGLAVDRVRAARQRLPVHQVDDRRSAAPGPQSMTGSVSDVAGVDDVVPLAPEERVGAGSADDRVAPEGPVEPVGDVAASDGVGVAAAGDVLDVALDGVVLPGLAVRRLGRVGGRRVQDGDRHAAAREAVGGGVDAGPADEDVGAAAVEPAVEQVVAVASVEAVEAVAAAHRVVAGLAVDLVALAPPRSTSLPPSPSDRYRRRRRAACRRRPRRGGGRARPRRRR